MKYSLWADKTFLEALTEKLKEKEGGDHEKENQKKCERKMVG